MLLLPAFPLAERPFGQFVNPGKHVGSAAHMSPRRFPHSPAIIASVIGKLDEFTPACVTQG